MGKETDLLIEILSDRAKPPLERLRALVHVFIRSECKEAAVRVALDDAAPLYRDAPEAREAREAGDPVIEGFMEQVLPDTPVSARAVIGDLIMTTMTTVGKQFSEIPRTRDEIDVYSDAMAEMLCAYLLSLGAK